MGSGFSGPARVLSAKTKCAVTALELQEDAHEMAEYLTKRCAPDESAKRQRGAILSLDLDGPGGGPASFDGILTFLVFFAHPAEAGAVGTVRPNAKARGNDLR